MAQPRETRFEDNTLEALEGWEPDGQPIVIPFDDADALEEAIRAAAIIVRWIGGAVTVANFRIEIAPRTFIPGEFYWSWNSFFPTQTLEQARGEAPVEDPTAAEEPESEAEPVAAEA